MNKRKSHASGKDIYLLGRDEAGILYWMAAPSWDCDWYWGFGYIRTYTNNHDPSNARDMRSHEHFDTGIWNDDNPDHTYIYHINESPRFADTVLSEDESWELSDLMKRFYTLKDAAAIFHQGNANYTSRTEHDSTNEDMARYINEVELPKIFKRVIQILSPEGE